MSSRFPYILLAFSLILVSYGSHLLAQEDPDIDNIENIDTPISTSPDRFPMFRGDPAKTGNSTADGPDTYRRLFESDVGSYCSPVSAYDQFYYCAERTVWCYDLTGNLVWSFITGDIHWNTPLITGGRIYVTGDSGRIWCLEANQTSSCATILHWSFDPDEDVEMCTSSLTTDGTRLFYSVGTEGNGMIAVWLSNGTQAWNASLDGSLTIESSPAYHNGRVYTGAGDSYRQGSDYMYCFYANNGTIAWKYAAGRPICSTPAVEYGRVYFGSTDNKVYCLDSYGSGGTTTEYWTHNVQYSYSGIASSPAVAYGRVYIGDQTRSANLYCLDAYGGSGSTTEYWKRSLTPAGRFGIDCSPTVTSDRIYVGTTGNAFYCLNRSTGATVWSKEYEGGDYGVSASPAVMDNMLLFASDAGNIYAVIEKTDFIHPTVIDTYPSDGSTEILEDVNITVRFSEDLDDVTITEENLNLTTDSGWVNTSIGFDMSNQTVWIVPMENLSREMNYTVTVREDLYDIQENNLDGNGNGQFDGPDDRYLFSFSTRPYYKPEIDLTVIRAQEEVEKKVDLRTVITDRDSDFSELHIHETSEYGSIDLPYLKLYYPEGVIHDTFEISVFDGHSNVTKTIIVNVTAENDAPYFDHIDGIEPVEDVELILDLSPYIHDDDGDILEIFVDSPYAVVDGHFIIFNYPEGVLDDEIIITLSDGIESAIYILDVSVTPVNDPPMIIDINGETGDQVEFSVMEDSMLEMVFNISDPDGPEPMITFTGDQGMDWNRYSLSLRFNPSQEDVGVRELQIVAFDPLDPLLKDRVNINITVVEVNDPPVPGEIMVKGGGVKNLTIILETTEGTDEEGSILSYVWEMGDGSPPVSGPDVVHTYAESGNYSIKLTVSDGENFETTWLNITITAPDPDPKPEPEPEPEPDNNISDPENNETGDEKKDKGSDEMGILVMIIGVLILLILIVVIVAIVIVGKSKREHDPMSDPDAFMARYGSGEE